MFALRLVSEAAGQAGVFGQVFGDAWRVAGLGAELPLASRITSVALDRALYTLSGTIVTIAGITTVAFLLPLPGKVGSLREDIRLRPGLQRVPGGGCRATALAGDLRPGRGVGHELEDLAQWVERKREAIQSVEDRLLDFFHHSPGRVSIKLRAANGLGTWLRCWRSI